MVVQLPLACQSLNLSQAVGRREGAGAMLCLSRGESYESAGGVSSTQAGWAENEAGVTPQRRLWGRGNGD